MHPITIIDRGATCEGQDCHRRMTLRQSTVDESNRSVEAIIAPDAVVRVFWYGRVIDEVLLMRGAQLPESMPLIDEHDRTSTANLRGTVRQLRIEGTNLIGRLYFGSTAAALEAWRDVLDGHLTDVSVGAHPIESVGIDPGTNHRRCSRCGSRLRPDSPLIPFVRGSTP